MQLRPDNTLIVTFQLPLPPPINPVDLQTVLQRHQLDPFLAADDTTIEDLRFRLLSRGAQLFNAALLVRATYVGHANAFIAAGETVPSGLIILRVERTLRAAVPPFAIPLPLYVTVHAIYYAVRAARIPPLPRTTSSQLEDLFRQRSPSRGAALLPVITVQVPSPETFAVLNEWIYLRQTETIVSYFAHEQTANRDQIMSSFMACSGLWDNAVVLGILPGDVELSGCLQGVWRRLRRVYGTQIPPNPPQNPPPQPPPRPQPRPSSYPPRGPPQHARGRVTRNRRYI
jgi:hypothetical protein